MEPSSLFTLVPWIVFFPVIGLLVNIVIGGRLGERAVGWIASLAAAAATAITKNTKICPLKLWSMLLKATITRLAEFSISSTDMKMMRALRRINTPSTPMVNRTAERRT